MLFSLAFGLRCFLWFLLVSYPFFGFFVPFYCDLTRLDGFSKIPRDYNSRLVLGVSVTGWGGFVVPFGNIVFQFNPFYRIT